MWLTGTRKSSETVTGSSRWRNLLGPSTVGAFSRSSGRGSIIGSAAETGSFQCVAVLVEDERDPGDSILLVVSSGGRKVGDGMPSLLGASRNRLSIDGWLEPPRLHHPSLDWIPVVQADDPHANLFQVIDEAKCISWRKKQFRSIYPAHWAIPAEDRLDVAFHTPSLPALAPHDNPSTAGSFNRLLHFQTLIVAQLCPSCKLMAWRDDTIVLRSVSFPSGMSLRAIDREPSQDDADRNEDETQGSLHILRNDAVYVEKYESTEPSAEKRDGSWQSLLRHHGHLPGTPSPIMLLPPAA